MSYIPLALKYRPLTFDSVIGNDTIVKVLRQITKTDKLSHGYFFSAKRGTGKTTLARIFARSLNCENLSKEGNPCNECPSCKAILKDNTPDFTELDAASENSVANIRRLISTLAYAPAELKRKIIVIDECHALSKQAASALLKTLEEPPEHVVFIFCTTDIQKVIPTIVSRCLLFEFKPPQTHEVAKRLRWICDKEGIKAEDKALEFLALNSYGLIRDAIVKLEQLRFMGDEIKKEDVLNLLGTIPVDSCFQFLSAVHEADIDKIHSWLSDNLKKVNLVGVLNTLLTFINDITILKYIPSGVSTFSEVISMKLKEFSGNISLHLLDYITSALNEIIGRASKVKFVSDYYLITSLAVKLAEYSNIGKVQAIGAYSLSDMVQTCDKVVCVQDIFPEAMIVNFKEEIMRGFSG